MRGQADAGLLKERNIIDILEDKTRADAAQRQTQQRPHDRPQRTRQRFVAYENVAHPRNGIDPSRASEPRRESAIDCTFDREAVHDIRLLGAHEPPQPYEQRQFMKRIEATALHRRRNPV